MSMTRINNRQENQMRPIEIEIGVNKHAEGSALVKFGDTHVICTATIENHVPRWMRGSNEGWITAEYGMLPRSTHSRMNQRICSRKAKWKNYGNSKIDWPIIKTSCRFEVFKR